MGSPAYYIAAFSGSIFTFALFKRLGMVRNWKVLHLVGTETLGIMALHLNLGYIVLFVVRALQHGGYSSVTEILDVGMTLFAGEENVIIALIVSIVDTILCYFIAKLLRKRFSFIIYPPKRVDLFKSCKNKV